MFFYRFYTIKLQKKEISNYILDLQPIKYGIRLKERTLIFVL